MVLRFSECQVITLGLIVTYLVRIEFVDMFVGEHLGKELWYYCGNEKNWLSLFCNFLQACMEVNLHNLFFASTQQDGVVTMVRTFYKAAICCKVNILFKLLSFYLMSQLNVLALICREHVLVIKAVCLPLYKCCSMLFIQFSFDMDNYLKQFMCGRFYKLLYICYNPAHILHLTQQPLLIQHDRVLQWLLQIVEALMIFIVLSTLLGIYIIWVVFIRPIYLEL